MPVSSQSNLRSWLRTELKSSRPTRESSKTAHWSIDWTTRILESWTWRGFQVFQRPTMTMEFNADEPPHSTHRSGIPRTLLWYPILANEFSDLVPENNYRSTTSSRKGSIFPSIFGFFHLPFTADDTVAGSGSELGISLSVNEVKHSRLRLFQTKGSKSRI